MRINVMKWQVRVARLALYICVLMALAAGAEAESCEISLAESRVDFGRIVRPASNTSVGPDGLYGLGQRTVSLLVRCNGAGELALVARGEGMDGAFRFSRQGQVLVTARNALLDGRSVQLSRLTANGGGGYGPSVEVGPGDTLIPIMNGLPVTGAVWSMTLEMQLRLPMADLRTADAQTPEAYMAFEVRQR